MEIMCHVMHVSSGILRQIREQSRSSGDRCMSKKKEENEKQSLKPTPPLGCEVKFSQEGR